MDNIYQNSGISINIQRLDWLLDPESVGLFDSEEELLVKHLWGAVGREVEPVETCMGPERRDKMMKSDE